MHNFNKLLKLIASNLAKICSYTVCEKPLKPQKLNQLINQQSKHPFISEVTFNLIAVNSHN